MKPVENILHGGILIASGIVVSSTIAPEIRIVLRVGGGATIVVGIVMLSGLAHQKTKS